MKKTFLIIIRILVSEASKQAFSKTNERGRGRGKKKLDEERFKEKLP